MDYTRADRVGDLIQREVSRMIFEEIKDPRIGMVTISRVQVSPDLHYARVFYTVYGDEEQRSATHAGLTRAASFVRRQLGQHLRLRVTPEVSFHFDSSLDHVARISSLLEEIERTDADRAAAAEGGTSEGGAGAGGEKSRRGTAEKSARRGAKKTTTPGEGA